MDSYHACSSPVYLLVFCRRTYRSELEEYLSFKLRRWIRCVAFPFLHLSRNVVYLVRKLDFLACIPLDCGGLEFYLDNAGHLESLSCDLQLTVVDFCVVACIALRATLSSRAADAANCWRVLSVTRE